MENFADEFDTEIEVSTIEVPKSFYVHERDRLYTNWRESIWRELFQNSVDAGSTEIHISISAEEGKGSFGRERTADNVIRIVFDDNGCGMTPEIIDTVFFKPGESTKRGDGKMTGGYGRARLMTAYSQVRYSIQTGDRAVEGDGPKFIHFAADDMISKLRSRADQMANSPRPDRQRIADLQDEATRLETIFAAENGKVKGMRFEVDLNPSEYPDYPWNNPTVSSMMQYLTSYLKMSQVPCKVFVNGEERKERLLKGPVKRKLSAKDHAGVEREFATVHTSRGDKADFKRQVLVRVDGATMFAVNISTDVQVIVELDKTMSRDILTANRDGFREPYATAFEELKEDIAVDVKSALDDDDLQTRTIEGTRGSMTVKRPAQALDFTDLMKELADTSAAADDGSRMDSNEPARSVRLESRARGESARHIGSAESELELNGFGGIPYGVLERFFIEAESRRTFLSQTEHRELGDRLRNAMSGRWGLKRVRSALEVMSEDEKAFIVSSLHDIMAEQRRKAQEEFDSKLQGLPDVRINVKGKVAGKLREAVRRNDPTNWNVATGQGLRARSVFAAWTVLCNEAIHTLLRYRPDAVPESFSWSAGFVYSAPREDYRHNRYYEAITTEALHELDGEKHYLMINPVDSDGTLKYNPRDAEDLRYMAALAIHEVSHIGQSGHNESFAELLTIITGRMDMRRTRKLVNDALDDVLQIYRDGKVRSQAMDSTPGPRPAERLLANAAPGAMAIAGLMSADSNRHLHSPVRDFVGQAIERNQDGTMEVDCDLVATIEDAVNEGLSHTEDYAAFPAL